MNLTKLITTPSGKYLISIILGLGLACLFRETCKGKNCVLFQAPPNDQIQDKIYKHGNKCYKYTLASKKCDPNKENVSTLSTLSTF